MVSDDSGIRRKVGELEKLAGDAPAAALPSCEGLGGRRFNLSVPRPASPGVQAHARGGEEWKADLERIARDGARELQDVRSVESDLERLALDFRKQMTRWQKVREGLVSSLHVLPPMLAVAYVFGTGDAGGATGIYAKLTSLFGLNDLWAVISIPAALGLNELDKKNLENLLGPIYRDWFHSKSKSIRELFEQVIARGLPDDIGRILDTAETHRLRLSRALDSLAAED